MFDAQRGRCAYSGIPMRIAPGPRTWDSASLDHIVPLSKGGANDPSNVCWVIAQVNNSKSDSSLADYIAHERAIVAGLNERFAALPENDNAMEAPDATEVPAGAQAA